VDYVPEYCRRPTAILGCGSVLYGDDGFGPAVISYLEEHYEVPGDVVLLDVGSGAREILFNIALSEHRPKQVIVVDAIDCQGRPGEVFTVPVESLPENKIDDFSVHQMPTSNLLKELRDFCDVEVTLLAVQPKEVPRMVTVGLSAEVGEAVVTAGKHIAERYFQIPCTSGA
jgi:coenzyme F420 hydrogenase subunit delta